MSLIDHYQHLLAERGFRADPAQRAAIERLEELRACLVAAHETQGSILGRLLRLTSNSRPLPGLYLWGGVGRGKTWLMDLFFRSLPFEERRRRHFHRFMVEVHASLRKLQGHQAPLEQVAQQIALCTRVLCFDEFFVADIADAMILGGLLEGLFKRGVTLVVTSNLKPADLYRDGLQRQRFVPAIQLIEKHMQVLAVSGDVDYRLRKLTQAGTYLSATDPRTPQRLGALFTELAEQEVPHAGGGTITIDEREIPVINHSEGIVWFSFAAICGGPRSQNDYIEIARDYQSVIVADIPVLDAELENEARRFIALVDELYDHQVNLIISAAAPAHTLYRGSQVAMQFERTVSRLTEMQSEEYLAREHRP